MLYIKNILKSSMDSRLKSGQAIIEYVIFIVIFAFAILAFYNKGFLNRVLQGKLRSTISSISIEQYNGDPDTVQYNSADQITETDMGDLNADVVIVSPQKNNYPSTPDLVGL